MTLSIIIMYYFIYSLKVADFNISNVNTISFKNGTAL